jgi:hypothetical protein
MKYNWRITFKFEIEDCEFELLNVSESNMRELFRFYKEVEFENGNRVVSYTIERID